MTRTLSGRRRRPAPERKRMRLGLLLFAVLAGVAILVLNKSALITWLTPGETITAEFGRNLDVQVGQTDVKIAGTKVGTVSGVDTNAGAATVVSMKVDHGTRAKLGTDPTAAIRPVTLLGGRYYLELSPGGSPGAYPGDRIPQAKTSTPVDLSQVLSALQPSARQGLQSTVGNLDDTLQQGGMPALQSLAHDAPGTLGPATDVLDSALGASPGTDLPQLVTNLNRTAAVLTQKSGQLDSVLAKLQDTAASINGGSQSLGDAIGDLPGTLRSTRGGMADLGGTLDKLAATAPQARPAVQALDNALQHLDPVLASARPVVADLRPLLADARPVVDQLVPTSRLATSELDDVKGPVLDRINGPILSQVNSQWRGTGPFAGDGANGHTVYQELGYLAARFSNLSKYYDQNGPFANLQAGVGTNSLAGVPVPGIDRLLLDLTKIGGAPK